MVDHDIANDVVTEWAKGFVMEEYFVTKQHYRQWWGRRQQWSY
jgi:hypothetical protein